VKLGLFGGSFDPIHNGHVATVRAAQRALGLDKVLFLPTAVPPHKPGRVLAPAYARYAMVELALLGEEGLEASAHELTLGRPAYTIETLEHFRRERPEDELFLLLGEDSFVDLNHWVRYREIVEAARLVVLARPGWDYQSESVPPELREIAASGRVTFLEQEQIDVSSTRLRELLRAGLPLPAERVPELVIRYLSKYTLYR
jgi:nicotinate-nucleotide adenylyltransferase